MNIVKNCLNWKVIGGLVVLGGVLLVMTPGIGLAAIPVLFMLACPLSMLVMMPLMMKGINAGNQPVSISKPELLHEDGQRPLSQAEQISRLKAQMAFLQSQQQEFVRQINQLESPDEPVNREAEMVTHVASTEGTSRYSKLDL